MVAAQPDKASAMGRAGREHVSGKFSRDAFGAQLHDLCLRTAQQATVGRS